MSVVIIDYGSGNLRSAAKAFERAEAEAGLGKEVRVTDNPKALHDASHVVLPGVGAFGDCRRGLDAVDGMVEALQEAVIDKGKPFLGICVGMQLMSARGLEHGVHMGLGWVPGEVTHLDPVDDTLKIPHMGWNELDVRAANHPILAGFEEGRNVYFVHSYAMHCENPDHVLATTDYGGPVTALVGRDNMVGTQFHPEKSQAVGLALITNFLKWNP